MTHKYTDREIIEAAKITSAELDLINEISLDLCEREQRPLVHLALCSALVGNIVRASKGTDGEIAIDTCLELIRGGVEV